MCSPVLFSLQAEDAPTPAMIAAVTDLLRRLTPAQRSATRFPVDSQLWRHWQNTELYVEHHGLRLDEVDASRQAAVMAVVRASLSAKGYDVSRDVMRLNRFLGDLVGGPRFSANGATSSACSASRRESEPWGWQLFGHHLSLNCFVDRPADGADAELHRRRAQLCRYRPVRRHPPVSRTKSAPAWR